jgi:hypothetical protein
VIRKLIQEVLEDMKFTASEIEEKTESIIPIMKDIAKKIFFEGKINDLKDFIFNMPNENHEKIKGVFRDKFTGIVEDGGDFIEKLKDKVNARIDEAKGERNIESLLDLFDYGHLKGFLKMFKI